MKLMKKGLKNCAEILASRIREEFKGDKPLFDDEWPYSFARAMKLEDMEWDDVEEIVDVLMDKMVKAC